MKPDLQDPQVRNHISARARKLISRSYIDLHEPETDEDSDQGADPDGVDASVGAKSAFQRLEAVLGENNPFPTSEELLFKAAKRLAIAELETRVNFDGLTSDELSDRLLTAMEAVANSTIRRAQGYQGTGAARGKAVASKE